jgi:hypothetical protein
MRKLSELTKFICELLNKQRSPKNMKWITKKTCEQFNGKYDRNAHQELHRKIWNSVWNSCSAPMKQPRLRSIMVKGETMFEANR